MRVVIIFMHASFHKRGPIFPFSYGDKTPRSGLGRVFSVTSTLIGLVTIAILLGSLTSSLTTNIVFADVKLYGTKVIGLSYSF